MNALAAASSRPSHGGHHALLAPAPTRLLSTARVLRRWIVVVTFALICTPPVVATLALVAGT